MRSIRILSVCVISLLAVAEARGQQVIINGPPSEMPVPFPGMGPRQFKSGTARIRGRVVAAETGSPVRRAQLRIAGPDIGMRTAMTDADGRYEFRDLPAGSFSLTATKSGYVTVQYGQTRPFEAGKPIELADGQVLEKADIGIPRGSVISGRVLDEFGEPVSDAMVSAMRSVWSGGRRRLQPSGRSDNTNDLGQFRIYGLSPGDYYVSATLRGGDMGMMEAMMPGRGGAGGPSGSNTNAGFAPTYFPGTANGAEAQKITLAAGQEAQSTDFALLPVRLARITGSVVSAEGHPVEGSMVFAAPRSAEAGFGPMMGSSGRTDRNGNFTLSNVTPGEYTLQTRAVQVTTSGNGDNMTFMARIGGAEGADAEFGSMPISVAGEDLSNVVIVTAKGATIAGRVTFEGAAKPGNLTGIRITATPADADGPMMMGPGGGGGAGTVKADGTFELRGIAGSRLFRAVNLPQGWMLKAILNNGVDVTDSGVDLKPGEALTGLEVVLTSKVTVVSGTVKGAGTQQVNDYTLVLFSDEPQRWTAANSRYVVGRRPDQDGRFQVKNLPPGGYYAIAVDYLPQGEWNDPEVLERLKAKATTFTLDEGETKTLDLRIQ